jgi:hypothetical protein
MKIVDSIYAVCFMIWGKKFFFFFSVVVIVVVVVGELRERNINI